MAVLLICCHGIWEGSWTHCRHGWDSQTCLLLSPEQSQEYRGRGEGWCLPSPRHSPVFVLCLQRLLTTVSPLQLLLVALMCALAGETLQPKRKLGKFNAERLVPARVSCELLWFECGFLNPFPSRRFGRCSSLHLWEVNIIEGEL